MVAEQPNDGDTGRQQLGKFLTPEVRSWYRMIGSLVGGWKTMPREQRVMNGKLYARRARLKKLELYGPTGQRAKPYADWCKAHSYKPKTGE